MTRFVPLIAVTLLAPGYALAQDHEDDEAAPEPQGATKMMSATFSPIHLLIPVLEVTGEMKLDDSMGAALILGYGQFTSTLQDGAGNVIREEQYAGYELGAQFRYYAVGDFDHGMQVGAEMLYVYIARDANDSIAASGEGLAAGPFVGYKFAASFGLTFEAQLGFEYYLVQAEAEETTTGQTASAEDRAFIPLLNLNVGWSF